MEVSIILRAYNEAKDIKRCIKAMLDQDFDYPYEIVVVFNTDSTDKTLEIVESLPVKIVKKGNYNPGGNLNFGISNSDGKYAVITSAHCYPTTRDWLKNLHRNFDDPKVAAVFGKHLLPENAKPMTKRAMAKTFGDKRRVSLTNPAFSNVNSMLRRDIWEKSNFDMSPGNVVEDICWAREVQQKGYSIVYEPEAPMIHYHNESLKRCYRRSRTEGYGLMYTGIYPNPLKALITALIKDKITDSLYLLPRPKYWHWLFYAPFWNIARNFGLYAGMMRFRKDGRKPMFELTGNKLWGD